MNFDRSPWAMNRHHRDKLTARWTDAIRLNDLDKSKGSGTRANKVNQQKRTQTRSATSSSMQGSVAGPWHWRKLLGKSTATGKHTNLKMPSPGLPWIIRILCTRAFGNTILAATREILWDWAPSSQQVEIGVLLLGDEPTVSAPHTRQRQSIRRSSDQIV
jgi:hypothetical protein